MVEPGFSVSVLKLEIGVCGGFRERLAPSLMERFALEEFHDG